MSQVSAARDDVAAEVAQAWVDHVVDPASALARLEALCPRLAAAHLADWSDAVAHAAGPEHLGDPGRGLAALHRAADRFADDPRGLAILHRARAVLHLHDDAPAEAEAMFDALVSHRAHHEAWALLVAARGAVTRGRIGEALGWFRRGVALSHHIGDRDPVLRTLGEAGVDIGRALLKAGPPFDPPAADLLRGAASLARVAAERAGTWQDVQQAEVLLSAASAALGEPYAAVAHAEAAAAMCRANRAPPELLAQAVAQLDAARRALSA